MSASASSVRGEAGDRATYREALSASTAGLGASLRLEEVTRDFGAVRAVERLSLNLEPGRFLTILGPSGAGKSTALHLVAGLLEPTSGTIHIDGRQVDGLPPEHRNVGLVFQNYALFPHLSVAQNLAFPLEMRGVDRAAIKRSVAETLDLVGLHGLDSRRPQQLSGGQQQRVALGRVLIYRPQIVLMDEPLGALDRNLRQQMQVEIGRLHDQLGLTVVYVTHDQSEAMAMSDLIAVMESGRIAQVGSPREVYARPHSSFVATFLGEANLVPGEIAGIDASRGDAYATTDPGLGAHGPINGGLAVGQRVTVVVRPEDVRIGPVNGDERGLRARVTDVAYVGDAFRIQLVDDAGRHLLAKLPAAADSVPAAGDLVAVYWPAARATFVTADQEGN